jgi:hypothetical protein
MNVVCKRTKVKLKQWSAATSALDHWKFRVGYWIFNLFMGWRDGHFSEADFYGIVHGVIMSEWLVSHAKWSNDKRNA